MSALCSRACGVLVQVKLLKCLVDNIVVDISFNQMGGLITLNFLEEINNLIGNSNIFKRSIILVRAPRASWVSTAHCQFSNFCQERGTGRTASVATANIFQCTKQTYPSCPVSGSSVQHAR